MYLCVRISIKYTIMFKQFSISRRKLTRKIYQKNSIPNADHVSFSNIKQNATSLWDNKDLIRIRNSYYIEAAGR